MPTELPKEFPLYVIIVDGKNKDLNPITRKYEEDPALVQRPPMFPETLWNRSTQDIKRSCAADHAWTQAALEPAKKIVSQYEGAEIVDATGELSNYDLAAKLPEDAVTAIKALGFTVEPFLVPTVDQNTIFYDAALDVSRGELLRHMHPDLRGPILH